MTGVMGVMSCCLRMTAHVMNEAVKKKGEDEKPSGFVWEKR